jgi:subtilisin family serine protease
MEKKVDIITMSLGLNKENYRVQEEILNAVSHRVLIFAAASNGGGNRSVTYPARKDEVICVYATDGIGTAYNHNPTPMDDAVYDFAILGVGVKSAWPRHLQTRPLELSEASERRMTGTSFATPIAAGMAACIIDFAYLTNLSEDLLRVLKSRQGMQKSLKELMVGNSRRQGLHYIYPWAMFESRCSNEDRSNEEIKCDMKRILGC